MDGDFGEALAAWDAFYAFTGGSAATLLGLLFVAVSLRLDLFRRREVADVRDYATFTFAGLLAAMIVAGIALAPHVGRYTIASPLVLLGLAGLTRGALLFREWIRLNPPVAAPRPPAKAGRGAARFFIASTLLPFVGLVTVGGLLLSSQGVALPTLAVVQGLLLTSAATAAWILLSHAGADPSP